MPDPFTVPPDVFHVVGVGPTLIDRVAPLNSGIVKTVRGSVGQTTSFVQEGVPVSAVRSMIIMADVGVWRIKMGDFTPKTFATGDVNTTTDVITKTAHNLLTGQGPFQFEDGAGDFDVLPGGLSPVKSTGVLTLTGNAANTETVTIDAKTYTFQTVLTNVDGNVLIGATASDSIDNLVSAITLGAGSGSLYAASTTLHPTVSAVAGAGDTMDAIAKAAGTAGDVATTETITGSWANVTLIGGLDSVSYFIVKVTDDTFSVALTRAAAFLPTPTVVDLTDVGVGTHTITGMQGIAIVPAASISDGSGAVRLAAGQSIEVAAHTDVTVLGSSATDVLTYFWE